MDRNKKNQEGGSNGVFRWYVMSVFLPGLLLLGLAGVLTSFDVEKDTVYWIIAPGVLLMFYVNGRGLRRRLTSRE